MWWQLLLCPWILTRTPTSERERSSTTWALQALTSGLWSGILLTTTRSRWRGWLAPTDLINSSHLSRVCFSFFYRFRSLHLQVSPLTKVITQQIMKFFVHSLFVVCTRDRMEHGVRSAERLSQPIDGVLLLSILVSHRELFQSRADFNLARK